jgi:TonB family protein
MAARAQDVYYFIECFLHIYHITLTTVKDGGVMSVLLAGRRRGWGRVVLLAAALAVGVGASDVAAQGKPEATTFTDLRDGRVYKAVKMPDGKTWMGENLNYKTVNSWCYGNDDANCKQYGRLYDWNTAKTACPAGWHLPLREEWRELVRAVDPNAKLIIDDRDNTNCDSYNIAGKRLKSKSGWGSHSSYNGTDDYGFSALPGGYRGVDGSFNDAGGNNGCWWTTAEAEYGNGKAYGRIMGCYYDTVNEYYDSVGVGFSVRCVQGDGEPQSVGFSVNGARLSRSIQRVIMHNMAALRSAYNKRLREKPGLAGKITVKFAINEFGDVISAKIVESTISDSKLESTVVARVKNWNFEMIDKDGDVTEVTYPFVFSD